MNSARPRQDARPGHPFAAASGSESACQCRPVVCRGRPVEARSQLPLSGPGLSPGPAGRLGGGHYHQKSFEEESTQLGQRQGLGPRLLPALTECAQVIVGPGGYPAGSKPSWQCKKKAPRRRGKLRSSSKLKLSPVRRGRRCLWHLVPLPVVVDQLQ